MAGAKAGNPGRSRSPLPAARPEIALILVFLLFAAGSIFVGSLYFFRYEGSYRAQVESHLASVTDLKIAELQHFRTERLGDAALLSGNRYFSASVGRFLENPGDRDARMRLEEWMGRFLSFGRYDRAVLMDAGGTPRLSVPRIDFPMPDSVRRALPEAFRSREPMIVDFYRDPRERRAFLELLIPFFDPAGGKRPMGALAMRIDPDLAIFPSIRNWPDAGKTAEAVLIRREGDSVVYLNRLRRRDDPPLSVRIPVGTDRDVPVVQAALGREGIMEGADDRGVPVLADARSVPGSPWYLVVRMNLSEVYAPVREKRWLLMVLEGVLLLAGATAAGLLWRWQRAGFYKKQYEAEKEKIWLQDVISRSLNEIYVFDPETLRFKYVNTGGRRNLGYEMEELSGMTPVDIKPLVTEEAFRGMIRPLTAGERSSLVFETVHRRKDDSEYPVEVHLQLVPSVDGAVFLAIINDITERRRAEERVRAGRLLEKALYRIDTQILEGANLREVLETVCGAIVESGYRLCWIGQPESGGKVRATAFAGPAAAYIEGIDVRWDSVLQGPGPTGMAVRTGAPCVVGDTETDPIFAPWKERARLRGLRSMAAFPLASSEGKMVGVMNVYADRPGAFGEEEISRLETFARQCSIALLNALRLERLRDADQRLTFQVGQMPLAYIVWDTEYRVTEWNPAAERIFGWKAEEAVGMPIDEIVPSEARSHIDRIRTILLESGAPGYSLNENLRRDGKRITCEWFNTPLRDAAGNITAVLSLAHDVTEKTELQRQLQTAQRMEAVGTLAGGIAHDFNNALTGIFGFAEMLKMQLGDNRRAQDDLDQILRSAERASVLTRQLLAFARRQAVELSNVGVNRVIEDLMRLFSKAVGAHIEIRTCLAAGLPSVRADVGQIEQVIMNLVLNARDAMPNGGRLRIETGLARIDEEYVRYHQYMAAGTYVVLTVSDTGVGMDRKTQERVFDPFFTTKGPEKGTGLGLAMVYGIVKQHNGFIHLYSEPGKGTTFKVYLPPVDAPPDEAAAATSRETRGGTETILLAEDDEGVRTFVERTLSGLGYTVFVARDGREAVETFRKNRDRVDLAVLDMVMPVLGGKGAYEELHRERPDLKVIFMSGYAAETVQESFLLIAGVPFLAKPMGPGVLARKVREVLDAG